jgi:hypothetical protein
VLQVFGKHRLAGDAILKTGKVGVQFAAGAGWKGVDPPTVMAGAFHKALALKERKVFGNVHLSLSQKAFKMAHTKRPISQKVQDSQPGFIAEALVNSNQVHRSGWLENKTFTAIRKT